MLGSNAVGPKMQIVFPEKHNNTLSWHLANCTISIVAIIIYNIRNYAVVSPPPPKRNTLIEIICIHTPGDILNTKAESNTEGHVINI